jgi:hypothetical protein
LENEDYFKRFEIYLIVLITLIFFWNLSNSINFVKQWFVQQHAATSEVPQFQEVREDVALLEDASALIKLQHLRAPAHSSRLFVRYFLFYLDNP